MTKWYYYICSYGPGHQGESDGFIESDASISEVGQQVVRDFSDYEWPIAHVWPVDRLPAEYIQRQIKHLKERIADAKEELKKFQALDGIECPSEEGKDEKLAAKLGDCVRHSLMKCLHNQGLIIRRKTIKQWGSYGDKHPAPEVMPKVLAAVRRAKKYSNFNRKRRKQK